MGLKVNQGATMIDVYLAKAIITLNPSLPEATAIAIRDGEILEVGNVESLSPWLIRDDHQIIETFKDCVIVPGFIDPHLHPAMAAVILPMHFITAMPWSLPWCDVPASLTPGAFDQEMQRINESADDEILIFWGHHDLWHGLMNRDRLDAIDAKRPIVAWNRSFHELHMNSACMAQLGITEPRSTLLAGVFSKMACRSRSKN
jgi:predicted amidohydrolase YtcJ